MSDLLLWFLIIATVHNIMTYGSSYFKAKWVKWRIRKLELFTYASDQPFYESLSRKKRLKHSFYFNGAFYLLVDALVSNSFLDFFVGVTVISIQYVALYRYYLKQTPTFYAHEKGLYCQVIAHPMDREHIGRLKWDRLELMEELELPQAIKEKIPHIS